MQKILLAGLCLAAVVSYAEPIAITKSNKFAAVDGGVVEINGVDHGVISVSADLKIDKPVKIRMKMRRVAKRASEVTYHFGLNLSGGDNYRAHFYSQGTAFLAALHQGKNMLDTKMTRNAREIFPPRADAPWVALEIYVQPKVAEIHVDGLPQGMVVANLLPLRELNLYGYHTDIEVKDLDVEYLPEADRIATDPRPVFQASFEGGYSGLTAKGELSPAKAVGLETVPGVSGHAVRISAKGKSPKSAPQLEYAVEGLFANHGTLMFWVKSDWDGAFSGAMPLYLMATGYDADGKQKLKIMMTHWLQFELGRTGELRSEVMKRDVRSSWYRGDWNHIAMVWSEGDWCKAYVNGLPYQQPFGFLGKIFANLDMKSITRFSLGTGAQAAEAAFDDVMLYSRPLSNGEIYDEYRRSMPIDLLVDRTVLDAGQSDMIVLLAAPGGYYMRPMPAARPLTTGKVKIETQLFAADGGVVAEKSFSLKLSKPTELKIPVRDLPVGSYRLQCRVGAVQRSFEIVAYRPQAAMPAGDNEIELGELIYAKDLKDGRILESGGVKSVVSSLGEYLEGGDRKEQRFAFEVPFGEKYLDGRPVMLEMEWPDDKPRSMGFYMYPPTTKPQVRDRLGGGIQSGVEFPLTGKMQKTRYLFFPGQTNYLFEARTMVNKFPAALAGFRVYAIKNNRLPKLEVKTPATLPARRFGYLDEDETSDQNLCWDYKDGRQTQVVTERLLDYLDYSGQDAWQYPFMRYYGYNIPVEGGLHAALYPYSSQAFRYMVDAMNRRGKITLAGINLFTIPELKLLPDETADHVRKGWTLSAYNSAPIQPGANPKPNHANPEVRAMIIGHVKEITRRFGAVAGCDGINFNTAKVGFFTSLDEGYDDYTVTRFAKETGISVPAKSGEERRAFLTQEPQLGPWLKWRAAQSVELFRQMRKEMNRINPDFKLYLAVPVTVDSALEYTGLFEKLQAIKGVYLVPMRFCSEHRHRLHWGKAANAANERLYDSAEAAGFLNGQLGFVDSFPTYFESFTASLKNDVYASQFQNADVKPFGRYFLKELAFAVSAMDAQRVLIGAQPLGTWGRDAEAREFAKAYCALPALPFVAAPGLQDPVTIRYRNTRKGSYLYAVSMLWNDCTTTLELSAKQPLHDLSSGELITNGVIRLKAFELRSFYSADSRMKVVAVTTSPSQQAVTYYREQLDRLRKAMARLEEGKIEIGEAGPVFVKMQELMKTGQFAELHRLLFSLPIRELLDKTDNFGNFSEQADMIRRGHYAVDCGAGNFYRSENGTLFFPDRPYGKGDYGYVGSYLNVDRNVDGLKAGDAELYRTEAYDLDTYKFRVNPGKYKVRLYCKAGFPRSFKPDTLVFNADIAGKRVLEAFDLFTVCKGDFGQVAIKEFSDIDVQGDVLEVRFYTDGKHDSTSRLLNAIEVIRL